jgi:hypothetical protein
MSDRSHAAILGGNRIPFAQADGPYARASNQDMHEDGRTFTVTEARSGRPHLNGFRSC